MQRSMSASSVSGQAARDQNLTPAATPPWERREVAQVPFMRTNSPPLTERERNALPSLWASSQPANYPQPELGQHVRAGRGTNYGPSPALPAKEFDQWVHQRQAPRAPMSAGLPPVPPMPYESVKIPSAPKTAPTLPSFVKAPPSPPKSAPTLPPFVKAPPSPPQSFNLSRSSTKSDKSRTHNVTPPPAPPSAPPLPGTMSTRDRTPSRSRSRGPWHDKEPSADTRSLSRGESRTWPERPTHSKAASADSTSFGKRFKTGFKNMFKRDPIDESQFERIGDRHWTDE